MRKRLSVFGLIKLIAFAGATAGAGCGVHSGTVAAKEPPPLVYQAPDIEEITGIEAPEEGAGSGAGSAK